MKGIVLAGGSGSRLYPLTKVTNKHLLPVGDKPMVYYPIQKMTECGIDDICLVTGTEHMGAMVGLLGSGKELGCDLTYRVQDRAGGIAQALGLAEHFVGKDKCVVILGDNIFQDSLHPYIEEFEYQHNGARLLLKQVEDPKRFGVAQISCERIVGIEEKPEQPKSNYAVTGIYMYDNNVFNIIKTLKPSDRGELEITDVNNHYIKNDACYYDIFKGWWTDAGTLDSLFKANELVRMR